MLSSLQSGLAGMQAHQTYLDVIGDNVANANTPGFKGSRITFTDLFSNTLRNASQSTSNLGGINPTQVGTGTKVGSVDLKMMQGSVLATGKPFDLGIQGRGFFVLSDGTQNFYTRKGTFGLDGQNYMVDLATGMRVQSSSLSDVQIEADEIIPPSATSQMELEGTLPAEILGPLQEVVTSNVPFMDGTAAEITGTNAENFTLADGDDMTIRVNGGASQDIEFIAADFLTVTGEDLADCTANGVATYINSLGLVGFTASTDGSGHVVFTTENTGESATLDIDDGSGVPANILGLQESMVTGTETTADETADLNNLVANRGDYVDGDIITITGTDVDGLTVQADFTYGAANDGTTLGDIRDFITNNFSGATCTLDEDGNLVLTADDAGEANLSLYMRDDDNANGSTLWPNFSITTDGTDNDSVTTSSTIYDAMGLSHTMVLTFTRNETNPLRWDLTAGFQDEEGIEITNNINAVEFNTDGSFKTTYSTHGSLTMQIFYEATGAEQTITFDFGSQSQYDGLSQVGDEGSVQVSYQDGYAEGELATISVETDGQILGHYTNGQFNVVLGQVGLAHFNNPEGLSKEGDSVFMASPNSGIPIVGTPETVGNGSIISGALEQSNVDIGAEFVSLIEAQKGFQANARIVTTSDEVLTEAVNLVR